MLESMKVRATSGFWFLAVVLVVAVVASPALAATVYTWTTEEGTTAFTDDPKRIPAKYKDAATQRTVGSLKNYPRLTESSVKYEKPYGERVTERLETLRGPETPAVSAAPPRGAAHPLTLDVSTTDDDDRISIPVTGIDEPIVTTEHRVRMRDGISTRHVRVTKQGDRILSVQIDRGNPGTISDRIDADVDALLPKRRY